MINEEKIQIAIKRMSEMFKELDLTLEEINIVTESGYIVTKKRLEKEKPQKISKIQIYTAVCTMTALVISIISILLELL